MKTYHYSEGFGGVTVEQDILSFAAGMQCEALHMTANAEHDLKAVVAIHNTHLGPALGGCRWLEYPSTTAAVIDAIRLAQAMSYKAAISNLPLGGGKMVLLKPKILKNKVAYFKDVGRFVNSLQGRYITAINSGTSAAEMDIIATETAYVMSTSKSPFSVIDPSVMAAKGVERGILAAVQFKLGKKSLNSLQIAIQGLGHAGYNVAKLLYTAGAKLTVYDINSEAVQRCIVEFGAKSVSNLDALFSLECDVFMPCALGAVLNDHTLSLLKAPIIAGIANNQLEELRHGSVLMQKGILYAPDYVINAGGLIYVAAQISHMNEEAAKEKINGIYDTLMEIFERSEKEKLPTNIIADAIARERLCL